MTNATVIMETVRVSDKTCTALIDAIRFSHLEDSSLQSYSSWGTTATLRRISNTVGPSPTKALGNWTGLQYIIRGNRDNVNYNPHDAYGIHWLPPGSCIAGLSSLSHPQVYRSYHKISKYSLALTIGVGDDISGNGLCHLFSVLLIYALVSEGLDFPTSS